MPGISVILDTDIGDDIDDAFCLALMLRSPEIELETVTTVFGNTSERADLAEELCRAVDRYPTVLIGRGDTMASRPMERATGSALTHRAREKTHHSPSPAGVDALAKAVASGDVIFSIGAMTNVAGALARTERRSASPRIVAMCGEFQVADKIEYNIRCDPEAAHLCFSGGVQIDVIPWSIGPATKLEASDIARLEASDDRLVKQLVDYLHQFQKHVPKKTNMYDPMTVVALLRPELFDWRRGRVSVELRDEKMYGLTRFMPDESGPHRVAFGVKAAEAKEFMMKRLLNEGN